MTQTNDPTGADRASTGRAKERWLLAAEVLLVLVIAGLIAATWLPALVSLRSPLPSPAPSAADSPAPAAP